MPDLRIDAAAAAVNGDVRPASEADWPQRLVSQVRRQWAGAQVS